MLLIQCEKIATRGSVSWSWTLHYVVTSKCDVVLKEHQRSCFGILRLKPPGNPMWQDADISVSIWQPGNENSLGCHQFYTAKTNLFIVYSNKPAEMEQMLLACLQYSLSINFLIQPVIQSKNRHYIVVLNNLYSITDIQYFRRASGKCLHKQMKLQEAKQEWDLS